jgi:hypothetical protein
MTSYVEIGITLWGGPATPKKEEVVEVVDTFLPQRSLSIMAANAPANEPAQTFFDVLSRCRSTDNLIQAIDNHYHRASRHPPEDSPYAFRYFNPTEYHITQIAVFKRRFFIQHEGFIFMVHHQPPEPHILPPEPDFLIAIDRNIDSTRSSFSFIKFAIDRVNCSLSHPTVQLEELGTFRRPLLWLMPAPQHEYQFNLNLLQVGALLEAIRRWIPNPQYHAIRTNCFSQSRIIRTAIRDIIRGQQPQGNNVNVVAHEPRVRGVTLGHCFCFHLDTVDQGESAEIYNVYTGVHNWLIA